VKWIRVLDEALSDADRQTAPEVVGVPVMGVDPGQPGVRIREDRILPGATDAAITKTSARPMR
jgi:hypothetical protein